MSQSVANDIVIAPGECIKAWNIQGIDIGQVSFLIYDTGYSFGSYEEMSDEEFDSMVIQAYENPSEC